MAEKVIYRKKGCFASSFISDQNVPLRRDPDGDQQVNLLEYAFNRNPKMADTSPVVTSSFANNYVYLSFPKNRNATDVVISCESSGSLQSWAPAASEIVSSTVTDFETEQVTLRVPTSTAPFFVRLNVVR